MRPLETITFKNLTERWVEMKNLGRTKGLKKWIDSPIFETWEKTFLIFANMHPGKEEIFLDGLTGLLFMWVITEEESDKLTRPAHNLMISYLKSKSFQGAVIEANVFGKHQFKEGPVKIKFDKNTLKEFAGANGSFLLNRQDVVSLIQMYKEQTMELHGQPKPIETKSISHIPAGKKQPAKYWALYHWILIKLGRGKIFEKTNDDKWPKSLIKEYAENEYGLKKTGHEISGQMFYQEFKGIDIEKPDAIANSFHKGYKKVIIEISKNDVDIITMLKDWPNKH